ncbi:MAG: hypothetical protein RSD63_02880 [Eubacterium sp.]
MQYTIIGVKVIKFSKDGNDIDGLKIYFAYKDPNPKSTVKGRITGEKFISRDLYNLFSINCLDYIDKNVNLIFDMNKHIVDVVPVK